AGSTFTFYHPLERPAAGTIMQRTVAISGGVQERIVRPVPRSVADERQPHRDIEDDRLRIEPSDKMLLIIEDDVIFARILLGLARDRGFKGIVAISAAQGLALARQFRPDAITLDVGLPDADGWALLQELKTDSTTADIPVHVISGEEQWQRALDAGAVTHLRKPITEEALTQTFDSLLGFSNSRSKNLLVVEDDITQLNALVNLIGSGEISVTAVRTGSEALAALSQESFDCIVVDLGLPDIAGEELITRMRATPQGAGVPVIVYTGRDLTHQEEMRLAELTQAVIVKDALSPERLMDEAQFFLRQVESRLPAGKRSAVDLVARPGTSLEGKCVLIVDDDTRNIFALRSVLEAYNMRVYSAEGGQEGIGLLQSTPEVDIVLMDIMMPELDGYETIRRIRAEDRFTQLPIIALTAKAMRADRESCIAAGASEYISKPVDTDQLVSLLRVWLSR
ncbi:MAG TPA: response regulator, partial [Candidatus Baltobacteraceae bacterium]|nr:response regulator [Candidatus Baltobacteraceae bacterium]